MRLHTTTCDDASPDKGSLTCFNTWRTNKNHTCFHLIPLLISIFHSAFERRYYPDIIHPSFSESVTAIGLAERYEMLELLFLVVSSSYHYFFSFLGGKVSYARVVFSVSGWLFSRVHLRAALALNPSLTQLTLLRPKKKNLLRSVLCSVPFQQKRSYHHPLRFAPQERSRGKKW